MKEGSEAPGSKARMSMLDTDLLQKCRAVANSIWNQVDGWSRLAQDTVGKQWIRSTDSIGANLVEGDGRGTDQDALRFFVITRASLKESQYWLLLASDRTLISSDFHKVTSSNLAEIGRILNAFIEHRKRAIGNSRVHETRSPYKSASTQNSEPLSPLPPELNSEPTSEEPPIPKP